MKLSDREADKGSVRVKRQDEYERAAHTPASTVYAQFHVPIIADYRCCH